MSSEDQDFIFREDLWLQSVQNTHHLFCDCGDWLRHLHSLIVQKEGPEWLDLIADNSGGTSGGEKDATVEEPTDQELLAALEGLPGDADTHTEGTDKRYAPLPKSNHAIRFDAQSGESWLCL